jgi:hypothetical protein
VLRDTLTLFPDFLTHQNIELTETATSDNLDYPSICAALISANVDEDLDNLLHLACLLGNSKGWSMIERQATAVGCPLPPPDHRHGYVDMALLTATTDWPQGIGVSPQTINLSLVSLFAAVHRGDLRYDPPDQRAFYPSLAPAPTASTGN